MIETHEYHVQLGFTWAFFGVWDAKKNISKPPNCIIGIYSKCFLDVDRLVLYHPIKIRVFHFIRQQGNQLHSGGMYFCMYQIVCLLSKKLNLNIFI